MKKRTVMYLIFLIPQIIWTLPIILTPIVSGNSEIDVDFIYSIYSPSCHQLDSRSIYIYGEKMTVCSRCFAIYLGMLISTIIFPFFPGFTKMKLPPMIIIVIASLPILLDGFSQYFGLRESTNALRLITGGIFGLIIPFYMIPAYFWTLEKFIGNDINDK